MPAPAPCANTKQAMTGEGRTSNAETLWESLMEMVAGLAFGAVIRWILTPVPTDLYNQLAY